MIDRLNALVAAIGLIWLLLPTEPASGIHDRAMGERIEMHRCAR